MGFRPESRSARLVIMRICDRFNWDYRWLCRMICLLRPMFAMVLFVRLKRLGRLRLGRRNWILFRNCVILRLRVWIRMLRSFRRWLCLVF